MLEAAAAEWRAGEAGETGEPGSRGTGAEHLADQQRCRLQAEADDLGEWIIRSARSGCGAVASER
jgi:hypothetical protein